MKKQFILIFLLSPFALFSQNEFNQWVFGNKGSINFNYKDPRYIPNEKYFPDDERGINLCDKNGNLLFFYNARFLFNEKPLYLFSYDDAFTELASYPLVIPISNSKNTYYIFYAQEDFFNKNAISDKGTFYDKIRVYEDTIIGLERQKKIHPNGRSFYAGCYEKGREGTWLMFPDEYPYIRIKTFFIDKNGLSGPFIIDPRIYISDSFSGDADSFRTALKFSGNGKYLGLATSYSGQVNKLNIYEWNSHDTSLKLYREVFITPPHSERLYNVQHFDFSFDGSKVYLNLDGRKIVQYDLSLDSADFLKSNGEVIYEDKNAWFFEIQSAPDDRIYIGKGGKYLSVINYPEKKGSLAGFVYDGYFHGSFNSKNICNTISPIIAGRNFRIIIHPDSACLGEPFPFELISSRSVKIDSVHWYREKVASSNYFGKGVKSEYLFKEPGKVTIYAVVFYHGQADTFYKDITVDGISSRPKYNSYNLCQGETIELTAGQADSFLWSSGESTRAIKTSTSGKYTVKQMSGTCKIIDSFEIKEIEIPSVKINNGDTLICGNSALILRSSFNAERVQWNTGEETSFINVNTTDTYTVTAFNAHCTARDSVYTEFSPFPDPGLPGQLWLCRGEETLELAAQEGHSFLWEPSGRTSPQISISDTGEITLHVTNEKGCKKSVSSKIKTRCDNGLWIPNAFSPNGDGINDIYTISHTGLTEFSVKIFSRWGEMVFFSDEIPFIWEGKDMLPGMYLIHCQYKIRNREQWFRVGGYEGMIHLLK